jgi:predicted secreted protein
MLGLGRDHRPPPIRLGWPITVAAIVLFALVASAGVATASTAVTLGEADSGRTITVEAGTPIQIVLPSNASTGFSWEIATAPSEAVLSPVPGNGEYSAPSSDLVGSPGVQTFGYETVGVGTTRLVLSYRRSWSGEEAGTFSLTIVVREAAESIMPATDAHGTASGATGAGPGNLLPPLAILLAILSLIVLLRGRLATAA